MMKIWNRTCNLRACGTLKEQHWRVMADFLMERTGNGWPNCWYRILRLHKTRGNVDRIRPAGTVLACLEQYKVQPNPSPLQIHLHVACLKKTRLKWVLEKATELGVDAIHLVDTEYTTEEGGEHYKHETQIIEAAEQCERLNLPVLQQESWPILLQQIQQPQGDESHHQWLVCRERSPTSSPLWSILQQQKFPSSPSLITHVHVLVGPEGGWSPRELEQFQQIQEYRRREQEKNWRHKGSSLEAFTSLWR